MVQKIYPHHMSQMEKDILREKQNIFYCMNPAVSVVCIPKRMISFQCGSYRVLHIHLCAKFWLGHNKTITKTTQLSIITLAKANLNMSCFLVKIYSLAMQLQFLDQKINNYTYLQNFGLVITKP